MTLSPNHRNSFTPRCLPGLAIAALTACVAALGCGDEQKFEARQTPRISRTATRSAPPEATAIDESESASSEPDTINEKPRSCAPDAVLTSGEVVASSGPVLSWPTATAAVTASKQQIEPQAISTDSAKPAPPPPTIPPIAKAKSTDGNRSIVTLAELETPTPKQIASHSTSTIASPSPDLAPAIDATPGDAAALIRQAEEYNRRGLTTASKGAVFSARKEFHAALQAVAAALDAMERSQQRRAALTSGLRALSEMNDFAALAHSGDNSTDVAALIAGHASQVVPVEAAAAMTVAALHERYMAFAVERLSFAAASPTGSVALHRLGKAELAGSPTKLNEARTKARVFLEAALQVDANNFPAANDLAVLLAEEGRYDQAVTLLRDGLQRSPQPALWTNLAAIHDLRGEAHLAQAARLEARATASRPTGGVLPAHNVAWVDARTFAAASQPNTEMQSAVKGPANAVSKSNTANSSRANGAAALITPVRPGSSAGQPITTALTPRRSAMVQ